MIDTKQPDDKARNPGDRDRRNPGNRRSRRRAAADRLRGNLVNVVGQRVRARGFGARSDGGPAGARALIREAHDRAARRAMTRASADVLNRRNQHDQATGIRNPRHAACALGFKARAGTPGLRAGEGGLRARALRVCRERVPRGQPMRATCVPRKSSVHVRVRAESLSGIRRIVTRRRCGSNGPHAAAATAPSRVLRHDAPFAQLPLRSAPCAVGRPTAPGTRAADRRE